MLESVMIYIANKAAVSAYILSKQGHDNKTYMLARSIFDLNVRTLGCFLRPSLQAGRGCASSVLLLRPLHLSGMRSPYLH